MEPRQPRSLLVRRPDPDEADQQLRRLWQWERERLERERKGAEPARRRRDEPDFSYWGPY